MKVTSLCVYCSSSGAIDDGFFQAAIILGELIAKHNIDLVYGGSSVGLMGVVAKTAKERGGRVIGVLPRSLLEHGIEHRGIDELIVAEDMRQRKREMESRSDAFVALPGGFGTLEELLEIITLKQLRFHTKPVVLLNTMSFYQSLVGVFEQLIQLRFAREQNRHLYHLVDDPEEVFEYLETYKAENQPLKWFK